MRFRPIAVLLPIVTGCVTLNAQQGRDDTTFTWSKSMQDGSRLVISNINGPITVHAGSGSTVRIRATKRNDRGASIRDISFQVKENGNEVSVCTVYRNETPCTNSHNWSRDDDDLSVSYDVEAPASLQLQIATGVGALGIDHSGAHTSASTGAGSIHIGSSSGDVDAMTGSGSITIEDAKGPVTAHTGSGHISVRTAEGPVAATTGSGGMEIQMTALGKSQPMHFSTGSGSIELTLPSNFAGEIDAVCGSGHVSSDFDMTLSAGMNFDSRHLRGKIGGGNGPTIDLHTGSGGITIRKG